ncbi:hypothetical protein Tco_0282873 [Tanacetum coccineum]
MDDELLVGANKMPAFPGYGNILMVFWIAYLRKLCEYSDGDKLKNLDWSERTIWEEGLNKTIQWYTSNLREHTVTSRLSLRGYPGFQIILHLTRRLSGILWKVEEGLGSSWKLLEALGSSWKT